MDHEEQKAQDYFVMLVQQASYPDDYDECVQAAQARADATGDVTTDIAKECAERYQNGVPIAQAASPQLGAEIDNALNAYLRLVERRQG